MQRTRLLSMRSPRAATAIALLLAAGATSAVTGARAAHAGAPHPIGADFNGDGYADVAIGVLFEPVNGVAKAGAVHVLYGSANGLRTDNEQYLNEATPGVNGDPAPLDDFSGALAHGDLNGDGYDDLAVGMPYQTVNGHDGAGGVHVFYGSPNGLGSDRYLNQATPGISGTVDKDHRFGNSLAIRDFSGDGIADLAIGAPWDASSGTVTILKGTLGGQLLPFAYFGSLDGTTDRAFGWNLAAGDFDGDGVAELAVAEPQEAINGVDFAGRVQVARISSTHVTVEALLDHTNLPGDVQSDGEEFGLGELAAGRIGDDKYDDLAIGSESYDVNGATDAGQVVVVRGGPNGIDPTHAKQIVPGGGGVLASAGHKREFGYSVAIGDANGDGRGDLAIGSWPADGSSAAVVILPGNANSVTTNGAKALSESALGTPGSGCCTGFGAAVAFADTNGDGKAALAIGSPWHSAANKYAGIVTVVPGPLSAKPAKGVAFLSEDTPGIAGTPDDGEMFGNALA